ncbi:U32 family peptidase C-terminal domain-containing protein [Arcanobacterium hippocoleae]|uniref:U32 family peptidase C-terminal domain-containing protein n=1 Tax=Arcanobacterium hippocoleae TaxID=149017 RepID=UPI003341D5E9
MRIYARNKIAPGMEIEFLAPGREPVVMRVPAEGLLDEKGKPVEQINHPAHEFSLPCNVEIPHGAMIRAQMKRAGVRVAQA